LNARTWFPVALLTATLSCHSVPDRTESPAAVRRGAVTRFSYGTTDGGELSSATTYGRVTVLLFVTTFDHASQVQAARLNELFHMHRPRLNAGAIALEPPKYALLADAFRSSLRLDYPMAIADDETRTGPGPFGRISRVPTLVVLDAYGQSLWQRSGITPLSELEDAVKRAERER
jgi:hypothetical protein